MLHIVCSDNRHTAQKAHKGCFPCNCSWFSRIDARGIHGKAIGTFFLSGCDTVSLHDTDTSVPRLIHVSEFLIRLLGSQLGRLLGSQLGRLLGSQLGRLLGSQLGRLLGSQA